MIRLKILGLFHKTDGNFTRKNIFFFKSLLGKKIRRSRERVAKFSVPKGSQKGKNTKNVKKDGQTQKSQKLFQKGV